MVARRQKGLAAGRSKSSPRGGGAGDEQRRQLIAQQAARLIIEEGIQDYALAKRKAVDRLKLGDCRDLPGNQEIEQAVTDYQHLFRADDQPSCLLQLRRTAVEAMHLLTSFRPRLTGPVLAGTADAHSPVTLHLFADIPEQLSLFLLEKNIPYELGERKLRTDPDTYSNIPVFSFMAGDVRLEIFVFCKHGTRSAPLSQVDAKPMARASIVDVEAMLPQHTHQK